MSLVQLLRAETAADHDRVDARYGGFALGDAVDYARFLIAHARALPAVEHILAGDRSLPSWRERTSALAADLAALGREMPVPLAIDLSGDARRWGALYVIEGSRLGGALLARGVPAGLPSAYLNARHQSGEWRTLLAAIDRRGDDAGAEWRQGAIIGARATFRLYAEAVA